MKKKVTTKMLMLGSILFLAGCSNGGNGGGSNNESEAQTEDATIKVNQGDYVLQEGESVGENEGYLALDVAIKNNTKDTMQVSSGDLTLYDEDDNKIANADVYTDDENFEMLNNTNLSGGKNVSGYVVFKVDKDKKYELHYTPVLAEDSEDQDEVEIDVDASKYKDASEELETLSEQYVSQVFLAQENTEDSDEEDAAELGNDTNDEHQNFNQIFSDALKKEFYAYSPSAGELQKAVEAFEKANQEKANVEYDIASLSPNQATVYVKPEVIDFNKIDFDSIGDQFVDENEGKYSDYEKAQQDAEKYILQKLPEKFGDEDVSQPEYMDGNGYKLNLTKEEEQWAVDTSDSNDNYDYKELEASFMGGLRE
ncbi:DUF4352 domain-containing protein [Tetragenococcus koreensis]|uniref:DUF4352 domain-containing protein n=1 Tax=Tetragenococcus koreensis TaxID=290335 RepID=A0AAN4UAI0_9ENTE|nr:DUF4352 domain-containing protein [Tetragenococcus koreensis]MCF1616856.1 DUF4352 domain-containing protein [Tetragenococcus koreensis]MCF1632400.1 DUF4352 domain-containing protein [Tetragenococcus koreensis]GEQ48708.1 hypothetical protein TK11N_05600 [Tetragenococcus koreensis]GEQ51137.1 hypothetical protein TK12N_04810 [Tetragenococcus koreensis]GEQ53710.1 hypothetical protein TK2N_05540 [Tetragenococcus koreensis]